MERITITLLLAGLTALLNFTDWAWRLDRLLYDAQSPLWSRPAPADVIIVTIDSESLAELGRWPWPRRAHAELIQRLTQARVVLFDVILAEPDARDPQSDRMLAAVLRAHGRVLLPVLLEEQRGGGPLVETLPLPLFAQAAAALGHTHVELDADGIVRGAYLREGVGSPYWPALSLAALNLLDQGGRDAREVAETPHGEPLSPYLGWRAQPILIPFSGPPGHYARVSYAQVLRGQIPPDAFKGKVVLIGATAAGMGDALPTAVSGLSHLMPGVEIHANLFDALRAQRAITPLAPAWQWGIGLLLAMLPAFVLPLLGPRGGLAAAGLLLAAPLAVSAVLLGTAQLWFPPAASMLALSLAYPLWSWRRLEQTVGFLNEELQRLHGEPAMPRIAPPPLAEAMAFVQTLVPVAGWSLWNAARQPVVQWGDAPALPPGPVVAQGWQHHGASDFWTQVRRDGLPWLFGVRRYDANPPGAAESEVLFELVRPYALPAAPSATADGAMELIQRRIQQVREAAYRMRTLRRFIGDNLAHMADGVLVCNGLGQVTLANEQAAAYFGDAPSENLLGAALLNLLQSLRLEEGGSWNAVLHRTLVERRSAQVRAIERTGKSVLVQGVPLITDSGRVRGLIFNLSDLTALRESEQRRMEALHFLSHDLRAPLVSLLALLEQDAVRDDESFSRRAGHYVRRTLELADGFLHLSRAENAEPLATRAVNLADVARNAFDMVWAVADAKGVTLTEETGEADKWVMGEAQLLERALVNLLSNAIKYSPPGSAVNLSVRERDGEIHCCVRDNGPGIAQDEQARIFEHFQRGAEGQRSGEGTGMGLAFVKAVATRHGGRVTVQSEPGHGAEFCLCLPASASLVEGEIVD